MMEESPCSNPEPHPEHKWFDVHSLEYWCLGINEPDEGPLSGMPALMAWLTEDYECNGAEITVTATGENFEDDDSPEGAHSVGWDFGFEVKLYETGAYGDVSEGGEPSWTTYEHRAYGQTLDEAADNALKMQREHYLQVVKPPIVISVATNTTG